MTSKETILKANNLGFSLIAVVNSWYMVWAKDGKKYGGYIPNVLDFEYDAANEIKPFLLG